ncbi:MAG: hypothetical protein KDB27_12875 [Planctomycetales bacterium]|nr:hypothetical protein [Planctomycetales bacterium]
MMRQTGDRENLLRPISFVLLGICVSFAMVRASDAKVLGYAHFEEAGLFEQDPLLWQTELSVQTIEQDGDLWLSTMEGSCCGAVTLIEEIDTNVSIRTQLRLDSGAAGLMSRWGGGPMGRDGYFAWVNPDGTLDASLVVRAHGGVYEFDAVPVLAPEQLQEDLIFQMDLRGANLSARVWPVSENPPLAPQWSTDLPDGLPITSGRSGVLISDTAVMSEAAFRYVQIDSVPIPITYDDFEDGNEAGWSRVQNIPASLGSGNYSVENGEYRMQSLLPIPPGTGSGNDNASMFSIFKLTSRTENEQSPDFRNGSFRVKVRSNEEGSDILNGLRNTVGTTAYGFFASTETGEFSIGSFRGSIPATEHVVSETGETPFQVGEDWILEGTTIDNRATLKYWRAGDAEPATPQLVFLDPDPIWPTGKTEAYIGGYVHSEHATPANLDVSFDDAYYRFIDRWTEGDFSIDYDLDAADIDRLNAEIRSGENDLFFDLNGDALVNDSDRTQWVKQLKGTSFGDANLDGSFGTSDLVAVFKAGQYEDGIAQNSTWATGDWNGDGEFDTSDLTIAFQDGGFETNAQAVHSVPEPSSAAIYVLLVAVGFWSKRLRWA